MKRSCIVIAAALFAVASLAAVTHTCAGALPTRKGKIQSLVVEPSPQTTAAPVSVRVTMVDPLVVSKVTVSRLSHRHIVNIYWSDPPTGGTGTPSPGQYTHQMGTLRAGQYAVLIQTFYKGMLVDFKSRIFQVK